jgi:predicted NUDIX family NTP pyrophosphohydrolase
MNRNQLALASVVLVALGAGGALAQDTAPAVEETAKDIVATTVRSQGYACENPKRAIRDRAASEPDRATWVVECANASFRVKYDNDLPAEITPLD